MANQSKLYNSVKSRGCLNSLPYSCYECAHTWEPSCVKAWYGTLRDSMKFSVKVYIGFYSLSLLLKVRKKENRNLRTLKDLILNIAQSSLFLSMNGTLLLVFYCIFRHLFGKLYIWHGLLAGTVDGFISIRLERGSRRGLLALYLANLASETLFNMAVSRNVLQPIPHGEVFIFMVASAGFMALYRTANGLNEHLQSPLNFFLGKYENPAAVLPQETRSAGGNRRPRASKWNFPAAVIKIIENRLKKIHPHHQLCKHSHSCLHYILKGFTKNFGMGYGAQVCLNVLQLFRGRQKFSTFLRSSVKLETCSLGLFIGLYNALFRLCNCALRWATNKDLSTLFGAISGAVAGVASYFYKSSTISMYFVFKLLEIFCGKAVSKGWLPRFKNAYVYLYALSLGIVLQAACNEPHNVRPGYWRFICGISGGKFPFMFRKLFDEYGITSSKLYPNFVPNLDPKYVEHSRVAELLSSTDIKGVL